MSPAQKSKSENPVFSGNRCMNPDKKFNLSYDSFQLLVNITIIWFSLKLSISGLSITRFMKTIIELDITPICSVTQNYRLP